MTVPKLALVIDDSQQSTLQRPEQGISLRNRICAHSPRGSHAPELSETETRLAPRRLLLAPRR